MTLEILTNAEMGQADAFAIAHGIPSLELMENAGKAAAQAIMDRYKPCRVTVLCGPGNNGGDGFVVARHLASHGYVVRVALQANPSGDAATMSDRWRGVRMPLTAEALDDAELVVDGLFGAGLSRPLEGAYARIVEALGALPVVAIDVPSGLSGDSGRPLGSVVVHAQLTVTFFRKKPGHLLLPGRILCGQTVVADIGIPPQAANSRLYENAPSQWRYPWPKPEGHKYSRGHCIVLSGPAHATGAARLAARAALRAGSGLVSVACLPDAVPVNAAHLTAIMIKPIEGVDGFGRLLADKRVNAILLGPGLGVGGETREFVAEALKSGTSAVLDADALTSFQEDPEALFNRLHDKCVLTPHDGEFERLFPGLLAESVSKVEAARAAARHAGCVILLKGGDSVIASAQGQAVINVNAPPTLATAGAGDVLAGIIAGLMAQQMDAFGAGCAGAWVHGDAATRFGPGLIAEDLAELLPRVLAGLPPAVHGLVV